MSLTSAEARVRLSLGILAVLLACALPLSAHEVRPGFLEMTETAPLDFEVLWKVPTRNGMRLRMDPLFPDGCEATSPVDAYEVPGSLVERWSVRCTAPLVGRALRILGLEATLTDVLVRIQAVDGSAFTARLHPSSPSWTVPDTPSAGELTGAYLWLGIEHILLGVDHLLFVLGLLLLVDGPMRLLKTITAFTIAHSITLAIATFGVVLLEERAVNAAIALSILFLGVEIMRARDGHGRADRALPMGRRLRLRTTPRSRLRQRPDRARPPGLGDVPVALLLFNVGVEIGQLGFVILVLALLRATQQTPRGGLAPLGGAPTRLRHRHHGRLLVHRQAAGRWSGWCHEDDGVYAGLMGHPLRLAHPAWYFGPGC